MTSRPIAVIGLAGRYPGGAHTLEQLWANLKAGVDGVTDLPEGRWDRGYQHPDKDRKGRSYTYAGGYLDQVDGFDAEFFGMSPREATQMDPQHRLLLELAWEALEDAGVLPAAMAGTRTGVFVGLSNRDYGDFSGEQGINAYTNIGLSLSLAANRISYTLDLKGPSFTVDTACSSGMVALHQARLAMLNGECDMALVGAANLLLSPKPSIGFAKASMLSPAGRCTSFDAHGAGYVRAEGGGMLLLKHLDAAERDGDAIVGLIVASGVNSDGRTVGIALPNMQAQTALLNEVYGNAGIAPDDVFYLEAHGTGTAVGDPIECEAIARALGGERRNGPLRIGSIKSNIGHLEPAAGIAGLTKVLLALKHGELPANLHFNTPNPKIDFAGWKLQVVDQATPLPQTERPLLMGVNSFGFGGTNGHAVVQQYRAPVRAAATLQPAPWTELLVLSGQSSAALDAVVAQWLPVLDAAAAITDADARARRWQDLRAAALHGRTQHAHRLALHADGAGSAARALQAHLKGDTVPGLALGKAPASGSARTAWVYGGNGPQWWAMGRELLDTDPTYRAAVEEVDALFSQLAGWSLIDELRRDESTSRMAQTEVAQPTLFALQVGLTAVLRAAGLMPDAVFGHSVGEVAAAWASGALSLAQATFVIHHRSAAQGTTAGLGRMAALGIPAEQARALIAEVGGFLELAAINSPGAVTVAGDPLRLAPLVQRLTEAGSFARMLALDYAFHTGAMDGIQARLERCLAPLEPGATTVPFVSTVEGHAIEGQALGARYWWRNVREPVAFEAAVTHALEALQITAFIEIGPHPVLRDYLVQCAKTRSVPVTALATLRRPRADKPEPEAAAMWQTLAAAFAAGLGNARRLSAPPAGRIALPLYPWQRSRHWRGENLLPEIRPLVRRDHPLLGWRLSPVGAVWENHADTQLLPYLADHVIEDAVVFPGAGYVEQALAAAAQLREPNDDPATQLEDVDFLRPCVIPANGVPVLQVRVDTADGTFEITSRALSDSADTTLHSRGRLTQAEPSHRPPPLDIAAAWQALPVEVDRAVHYAGASRRGLHYGPAFQSLREMRTTSADDDTLHCAAWIELPDVYTAAHAAALPAYRSHPALLDGCLQTLITLLGQREARQCAYIPVRVDRLRCFAPLPRKLFCTARVLRQTDRSGSAEFEVYDEQGHCVMVLEGTRFQKVDFGSAGAALRLVDHWQRDAVNAGAVVQPIALPLPGEVLASGVPPDAGDARAPFDALAALYAADTLRALWAIAGLDAGAAASVAALQRRARVVPEQALLFRALVDMAVADGWLESSETGLRWPTGPRPAPATLWQQQLHASPAHVAELMLLAQVGERLPALLRGEAEPVRPSGAERGHPSFDALLDTAPWRAGSHRRAAEAVRTLVAAWPADRPLRVLELHAGGGGLAAAVLPALPVLRTAYTLTDPNADVAERLAQRHAALAHVSASALDLADAVQSAPHRASHDLVLCGDGLLACGLAPADALARARALLVPGGALLMIAAAPSRLATLLFGQDPAWWRNDAVPLLDADTWRGLWPAAGWGDASCVPDAAAQQTLWLARADAASMSPVAAATAPAPARHWLLLTDADDRFATHVAQALRQRGQQVRCQRVHETAMALPDSIAIDDLAAFGGCLQAPLDRVVQLAGLSATPLTAAAQLALQTLRCTPVLTLLQALKADGPDLATRARPHLRVVTHGAFMGPAAGAAMNPAQAPVWGLARVLANEHADLAPKMIDLHLALDAAAAERLADELLREDAETEVLLDAGGRWMHRIASATPASLALEAAALPAVRAGEQRHAVRLEAQAQGGLDALLLRQVPRRAPAAGEVEVAVRAAGLNFRDVLWAMNLLPEEAVEAGFSGATIGMECAGEIVAVGAGVQGFGVGDRVIGFASGCFASHVTTEAGALAHLPAGLSWEEAATVPTTFLTAMYALDHLARLEPGERVLIHGAAGGVGLAAVQIAKWRGAVVFGTAGTDDKRRLLRLYGVDHVLDSRSLAYADDVMALTGGQGVDVVLNSLAGEAITKNLQILRPFGRMLEIGKRDFYANSRIGLRPFRNNLSYFGIDADTLLVERPDLARKVFAQVAALFVQRQLHPLPFQALPIERAAQAFRLMQQSRHVGKIVVTLPGAGEPLPHGLAPAWAPSGEGTWLVTGGLGGFGLASAKWLAAQGVRHLALVSRRGATTEEAREGLAELQRAGCSVQDYAADVSDGAALAQVLSQVRAGQPPLRGVLHSAMVLDDGPMLTQTGARLQPVLAPKLAGAWHLHELTQGDALESFIVYSSATTVIGNPGQGNYVAANLYLEALVQWRRAQGLPGLAIAWGAIKDVGVLTRNTTLDAQLQQRSGLAATPAHLALAELGRMLACGASVVSVAQFNVQRLTELLAAARAPRFTRLAPKSGGEVAGIARQTLAERIALVPAEQRRPLVLDTLREQLGRILGTTAAKIDLERQLPDLGLDSLMAVELAQSLEAEVGRPVSVMQMIQATSALAVAELLLAGFETPAHA